MHTPPEEFGSLSAHGLLFDMDGTLLNSVAPMLRVWGRWASRHGLELHSFLNRIQGQRAIESIGAMKLPGVDAALEAQWIEDEEVADVAGVIPVPGAIEFLATIPRAHWAIVTSAPRRLAQARLGAAGIPLPDVIVCGEDVTRGKPNPDPFLLGAQRLGLSARDCIVFEDAHSGIRAAEAAGANVVVITATHDEAHSQHHRRRRDYHGLHLDTGNGSPFTLRAR